MKNKIFIALGIMAIIAAGYWWQASRVPAPQDTTPETLIFDSVKKDSDTERATVAIEYPYFKDAKSENQRRINARMDGIISDIEKDFDQNVADSVPELDFKSTLSVKPQILRNDQRVVSIRLDVGWYISGAAHPNAFTVVLNYDLANGREIALGDLFQNSSDYLARVATKATEKLKEKFQQENIPFEEDAAAGSAAKAENYRNFLLKKDELVVIFDPYQVGPWAIGIQEVSIPFSELNISI